MADRITKELLNEKLKVISNTSGFSFIVDYQMGKPRVFVGRKDGTIVREERPISPRLSMREMKWWIEGFHEMLILLKYRKNKK